MVMPYAAKATIEHEYITDHLEIYVTFDHPMKTCTDPLATPPVWDIMPPLNLWLLDADAADVDVVASEWLDLWTLLLTSDVIASPPSEVKLEYDGPDIRLRTSWDKQWEPFGPILSRPIFANIALNLYPQRATFWHDEATVLSGNAILSEVHISYRYQTRSYQTPPANGDSFTQNFTAKAGTYNFYVLGGTQQHYAKIDWYIDNVLIISGQDWYSVGVSPDIVKTATGIVITTSGYHVLKGLVNGRNANASDWYIVLKKYWLKPVSDPART